MYRLLHLAASSKGSHGTPMHCNPPLGIIALARGIAVGMDQGQAIATQLDQGCRTISIIKNERREVQGAQHSLCFIGSLGNGLERFRNP